MEKSQGKVRKICQSENVGTMNALCMEACNDGCVSGVWIIEVDILAFSPVCVQGGNLVICYYHRQIWIALVLVT